MRCGNLNNRSIALTSQPKSLCLESVFFWRKQRLAHSRRLRTIAPQEHPRTCSQPGAIYHQGRAPHIENDALTAPRAVATVRRRSSFASIVAVCSLTLPVHRGPGAPGPIAGGRDAGAAKDGSRGRAFGRCNRGYVWRTTAIALVTRQAARRPKLGLDSAGHGGAGRAGSVAAFAGSPRQTRPPVFLTEERG
jgi:hypothetical protein